MYAVWIKIDETLPWIELEGQYQTKKEAKMVANELLNIIKVKTVEIPERRRPIKPIASVKAIH